MFLPLLYASLYFSTHGGGGYRGGGQVQYIIRMLQYVYTYGNFQETGMVLFTICVMIILTPKQFPGLSVTYLQNSMQILNMIEISAV